MKNSMTFISFLLILLGFYNTFGERFIYVNVTATGNNNGTNWNDAFFCLQDALNDAKNGDIIWVAKGVYKPTIALNRTKSFYLKEGVSLYGGFAGEENPDSFNLDDRDFITNTTILSGDLLDNDNENIHYQEITSALLSIISNN